MTKTVECLFDIVSPAAYMAWHVLPRIADAAGASLVWTPVFLGGVMQASGNRPPGTVPAKGAWMARDLARWARVYGLDYNRNSVHPQMTLTAMRGMLAYQDSARFRPLGDGLFNAMFIEDREVQDPATLTDIVTAAGIEPAEFQTRTSDPALKDRLKANTGDAVARGMFGAPTMFVGEVMHFGQDRLWMVAEDLGVDLREVLGS